MSTHLGAFTTELLRFFEELTDTFPEEKELQMGLEALRGAKKINPKLILDLFYEHVYQDAHEWIMKDMEPELLSFAKSKIQNQFNEMSSALIIFDKHWVNMTSSNQKAIWKYLKVLCILCSRAKGLSIKTSV